MGQHHQLELQAIGSAEASEIAHKLWVKVQGDNTNQGPSSAKTVMSHSQSKVAAKMCDQAIAGPANICWNICVIHVLL